MAASLPDTHKQEFEARKKSIEEKIKQQSSTKRRPPPVKPKPSYRTWHSASFDETVVTPSVATSPPAFSSISGNFPLESAHEKDIKHDISVEEVEDDVFGADTDQDVTNKDAESSPKIENENETGTEEPSDRVDHGIADDKHGLESVVEIQGKTLALQSLPEYGCPPTKPDSLADVDMSSLMTWQTDDVEGTYDDCAVLMEPASPGEEYDDIVAMAIKPESKPLPSNTNNPIDPVVTEDGDVYDDISSSHVPEVKRVSEIPDYNTDDEENENKTSERTETGNQCNDSEGFYDVIDIQEPPGDPADSRSETRSQLYIM